MKPDTSTPGTAREQNKPEKTGIRPGAKISANPVISCRIEGDAGAVLFNPDTDRTRLINPTGIMVWEFIGTPRAVDEIVSHVMESFGNCPDDAAIRKDIEQFVLDLAPDFIQEADGNDGAPAVR
ncbi:MAG: PqqD family peptide modification chaperone [Methanoregula sp.]|nr:PqqD family peptide modification chaperone [Methanoregula sp.]